METNIEFKIGDTVRYISNDTPDWYGFIGEILESNFMSSINDDRVTVRWHNNRGIESPFKYNLEKIVAEWDQ